MLVHQQFEHQVELNPDKTALDYDNVNLSYLELNKISNQISRYLNLECINQNKIAVLTKRNQFMVIASLAIIKSAKAYIPLDNNIPDERKQAIITDAGIQIILTENAYTHQLKNLFPQLTILSVENPIWYCTMADKQGCPI